MGRESLALEPNPGLPVIERDMPEIVAGVGAEIQRLAGKTILITGAAGVLPGYLADAVAYCNRQVLDRSARLLLLVRTPPRPGSRLAHLVGRPDVEFLIQDAAAPFARDGALHFIIHAASPATPQKFKEDPVGTIAVNSVGLAHLLELARQCEAESLLFFSSSEIYGTPPPEHIPTPETYLGQFDFTTNRSFYAEAKRYGETLCAAYLEQYGVPVKSVRPFHVHGPGLRPDDGRIIAAMIALGLEGRPFALQSDGTATRTYGYVSDATVAFLKVLLSDYNGHAFNVGTDAPETSMLELATTIARLFDRTEQVAVGRAAPGAGSPARACPDLTKIRSLLGYVPQVSLESGLERTVAWLRAQRRR